MRKIILLIVLIQCNELGFSQLIQARIDERFELTSIVCRLAGATEYKQCEIADYAASTDSYFRPYIGHPLIAFMQEIRDERAISYDAISSMANTLTIHNGKIYLQEKYNLTCLSDSTSLSCIDSRWTKEILTHYITLLNDFYRKSRFHSFFESHQKLYLTAEARMNKILLQIDTQWFRNFFGTPLSNPIVYVSISNGPNNYAMYDKRDSTRFDILIGCGAKQDGTPDFSQLTVPTIVHEFSHRYCNSLATIFSVQVKSTLGVVGPVVSDMLHNAAYKTNAIIHEWLTRLAVQMYLREHSPDAMPFWIAFDQRIGIIWQRRAVEFMENFYANRDAYPHFCDFMPQLVGFFNFTAKEFDKVVSEYENRHPYVVSVYPAVGSKLDMKRDTVEFRISFSEPMAVHCQGYKLLADRTEELGRIAIPNDWKMGFWENEFTYVISLRTEWIKAAGIYGFSLNKDYNQNKKNYGLIEDFEATLNTGLK